MKICSADKSISALLLLSLILFITRLTSFIEQNQTGDVFFSFFFFFKQLQLLCVMMGLRQN